MRFAVFSASVSSVKEGGEGERGVSWKRTDLEVGGVVGVRFRKEDDEGLEGREGWLFAAEKSGAREGLLGWDINVEGADDVVGKPRNWEVRSSY